MKKLMAMLAVLTLSILAACGGGEETSGEEAKTISVAMVAGVESAAVKQMIPQFEEETGIKVDWNEFDYNTLYERIYNDLRNGGETYDVIFADDPWMPMFAGGGFLTPLDELGYEPDEDFVETSRQVTMWPAPGSPRLPGSEESEEPRYYGVPQVGNVQLFFYRKDILSDIPETWEDLEKAMEEHKDEIEYGFVHRGARGNPIATNFNAFLWSHGADFFDEEWNVTLDSPEAIKALERYLSFLDYAPEGVGSYNADEIGRTMAGGDGLTSIVWPAWGETVEDESKSEVVGKMGYGLVPKAEGKDHAPMVGNWIFGIPEGSDNKENALSFIEWASSKEVQTEMTKLGGIPTRTSVLTDGELLKDYPYLEAVEEGLQNAKWRPRTPLYSQVEQIYGTYLNRAVTGDLSAEETLKRAAKDIRSVMEENGY
ncbi:multiple sugar transport system substrate-binding protein [Halobacillus karajensis]|uniref:extracellular solute-binding protein n=1 Tax=Halobacillus karajensis TaxID=195088 RepID=UPI0008A7D898|nr:extracellular solute-binding protein [Halobacillus karajensis]SEH83461.1 multiple sugar transport system substrate-binding protein [Halobacillus karajensis]